MLGTLYLVATPIGNLEDITLRALRILKEVDLVAAEDTRHSRKLFAHFGIDTPLTSYFEHNEAAKGERLLAVLRGGASVALISDAGMPGIADPGFQLVRRCHQEGIAVSPVPGPSAAVSALAASGLPTDRFAFEGFLPPRIAARRRMLASLRGETRTLIFYEAPHRLTKTLADLRAELGEDREITVARELTKVHEEIFRGTTRKAAEHFGEGRVRGEIVLLVAPGKGEAEGEGEAEGATSMEEALLRHLAEGEPLRQAAKAVAKEFGIPKDEVYRIGLRIREQGRR